MDRYGAAKKRKRSNTEFDKKDRLSTLADELLVHILSFMPIGAAISTSELSRRWRFLWTRMTTLHFERYHTSAFINKFLIYHKAFKIRTFRLDMEEQVSDREDSPASQDDADDDDEEEEPDQPDNRHAVDSQFNSWIYFAISRSVEELTLYAPQKTFPSCLYTSQSVKYMKLAYGHLNLPGYIDLSSLRVLTLFDVELADDDVERLTSGCPVLETLRLRDCNSCGFLNINITNEALERVEVFNGRNAGEIEIDAPHLASLEFSGVLRTTVRVQNLDSLSHLLLDLNDHAGVVEIVNEIQPANLEIGRNVCVQGLYEAYRENITMSSVNTTYLHLMVHKNDLLNAARLVLSFPKLSYLKISLLKGTDSSHIRTMLSYRKTRWELAGRQLACSLLALKNVEIDGIFDLSSSINDDRNDEDDFEDENDASSDGISWKDCREEHEEEIELVRTFVNGGKALERLTLIAANKKAYHGQESDKFELLYELVKELLSFPRASTKLEIKFC